MIDLWPGLLCIWNHSPRGGYGYVIPVPAKVMKVRGERVVIEVERVDGSKVSRTVRRSNVWVACEKCRPEKRKQYACGCETRSESRSKGGKP